MSTDNDLHAAARNIADQCAKMASGFQALTTMATTVAGQAATLADKLKPTTDPEPEPGSRHNPAPCARFLHEVDRRFEIAEQVTRWPMQVLQGDQWHLPQLEALTKMPGAVAMRYATPVARRASDAPGESVCLPPGLIPDTWMLKNRSGTVIARGRDGDEFVDVGNPTYQAAAARFLAGVCQGQGWRVVWLDEVNPDTRHSYKDNQGSDPARDLPIQYPTQYGYAKAMRGFVKAVTAALTAVGVEVWVNLGAQHDKAGVWDAWSKGVAMETAGHTFEAFVTGWGDELASLENGRWKPLLDWVVWQGEAKRKAIYNAQTTDWAEVRYALATMLLGTSGENTWFAAGRDPYRVAETVWTEDITRAQKLGRPLGPYTVAGGIYSRLYQGGQVWVNPSENEVGGMMGTSGVVELH